MQNTAKLQMDTALKLAAELGLMTQIYNNRLAQLLRGHDVTYPQYVILNHILSCGPKGASISQIADAVEVLQPAVTKTVKKFTAVSYVQIQGVEADKRSKRVFITPQGAGFIGRLQAELMPGVLTCFQDWDESRLNNFAHDLTAFRMFLETNRV